MENKKATIARILPDGFVYTLNVIGIIVGTILVFVWMDWAEWYSDFDVEPSGLITAILALVLLLLPIALCLLIGGGIGYLASFVVGIALDAVVYTLVTFINRKRTEFRTWKEQKRASKKIKQGNKSISQDIKRLGALKLQLNIREYTKPTYNLCCLVNNIVADKMGFRPCLDYSIEQHNILSEIEIIESKIIKLAEQYKVVNDTKSADYYYSIVNNK